MQQFKNVVLVVLTTLSFTVLESQSASKDAAPPALLKPKYKSGSTSPAPEIKPRPTARRSPKSEEPELEDVPEVRPSGSPLLKPAKPQPTLVPKRRGPPGKASISSSPSVPLPPSRLGVLLLTPLVKQNAFDARFSTIGLQLPVTIALMHLTDSQWIGSLETGLTVTYSSLSLAQPQVEFTHLYFALPLYFKVNFPPLKNSDFSLEAFAGLQMKLFENDSRPTLDGGFHVVNGGIFSSIDPDFGVGMLYRISNGAHLRLKVSYLFLAGGVEFSL